MSAFFYIGSVLLVNVGFVNMPGLAVLWSIIVGLCFVLRDWCQHQYGHWTLAFMAAGALLSWHFASPAVALASAAAFGASELVDWLVYTVMRRPFKDRVLVSSAFAVPVDTLVFLAGIGFLSWGLFAIQGASKMVAAVIAWMIYTWRVKRETE